MCSGPRAAVFSAERQVTAWQTKTPPLNAQVLAWLGGGIVALGLAVPLSFPLLLVLPPRGESSGCGILGAAPYPLGIVQLPCCRAKSLVLNFREFPWELQLQPDKGELQGRYPQWGPEAPWG